MSVGKSISRVDAYEKVTGRAMYTADLERPGTLVARVIRSTIANGVVKRFHLEKALAVPGVVKILTCFDGPEFLFPTAGHPWSTDKSHQDVADRRLLNTRVRVWGDDIGAVIAENEVAAQQALRLIEVEYEEYPPLVTVEQAMAPDATQLHPDFPGNILKQTEFRIGEPSYTQAAEEEGLARISKTYGVQTVQHCHIETAVSIAWMEKGRIVIVSSTQIPHIVRRVIGQATGLSWGKIRVIKPYIGGGFGNKQEVLYEPLNAWLTTQVGGRPVRLELSREEVMACTRVRHAMDITIGMAARPDGTFVARRFEGYSNQGGYASHGHSIIANAANGFRNLYTQEKVVEAQATTVYTNLTSGGAMRGYGIPQLSFAMESAVDDLALQLGMDPLELRLKNAMPEGYVDPGTGITCHVSGLRDCMQRGAEHIGWAKKRAAYQNQTGPLRKGVGMAIFSYKTGVHPISLETASCRMILNQDGTMQLQMGATEIGQGADTVFTQMAAQELELSPEDIHIVSQQDTDVTPFDTGAYASRQTYVSGMALQKTARSLKRRILDYASGLLEKPADTLRLEQGNIRDVQGNDLMALDVLATEAFYSLERPLHITAEESIHCTDNTYAFGACFAEVEVDIPVGKVKVLDIINVHDSGVLINPQLAQAQVHGGMSMGLGYALGEQLLYNDKAVPLNNNLLDYKLPTALDTPELYVDFVETVDPTGPYGNKALGEPPAIPVAPAVRNAVLHATGVAVGSLPLNSQKLVEAFEQAGLLKKAGGENV